MEQPQNLSLPRRLLRKVIGLCKKDLAALLLADNADVNAGDKKGHTPLGIAAVTGQKDMAELLLAFGADVNAKEKSGWTALHSAVSFMAPLQGAGSYNNRTR